MKKRAAKAQRRISRKQDVPTPQHPRPKREMPAYLNVPVDLLCDIAWRISQAEGFPKRDMDYWSQCVREAFSLIRTACAVRRDLLSEIYRDGKKWDDLAEIVPLLNEQEKKSDAKVSFERGCQIATGLNKKKDAITRFRRAFANSLLFEEPEKLAKYEAQGFEAWDLAPLRRQFLRLKKNGDLRKPYERSGKYAKN